MRRIGIIGAGRIARAVMQAIIAGDVPGSALCAVLKRSPSPVPDLPVPVFTDMAGFLDQRPAIIIEAAGPDALRAHGPAALAGAPLWTISGSALADREFEACMLAQAGQSGHQLRLVSGAIAGLDAAAATARAPGAKVSIDIGTDADPAGAEPPAFSGSARQVLEQFHGVNVVAAIAFAGLGLDATRVAYRPAIKGTRRIFTVTAESDFGAFRVTSSPIPHEQKGTAIVAASILAALGRLDRPISAA